MFDVFVDFVCCGVADMFVKFITESNSKSVCSLFCFQKPMPRTYLCSRMSFSMICLCCMFFLMHSSSAR